MARSRFCVCVLCAAAGAVLALLLLLAPPAVFAEEAARAPASFINDVAPIFRENCFACHDARKRKGKLDMTTYEDLLKGGDHGGPVVPGKPAESYLLDRITAGDAKRMPPKEAGEALPKDKVAVIERWIREGAKLDAGLEPKSDLLRELRIRWKPPAPPAAYPYPVNVTALVFTPDARKLVVGGYHELTVWDAASGRLEKRVRTRAERAKAMAFLPDGNLVVAGGRPGQEGDIRIYDLEAAPGRIDRGVACLDGVNSPSVMRRELWDTDDEVLCLAVSPDGKMLAAGGCDRIVRIWDLTKGYAAATLEQSIENHADWVLGVAFSPDGKHLLTASRDKTAKVWDLTAKESVITFPDHQNAVYGVAARPDGKVGISVGEDNLVRYWNSTGEGKQIRAGGGHGRAVFRAVQHPRLPLLATCSADATVRLWNPNTGAALRVLTGNTDWVYALDLSRDGTLVASGAWNGEVRVWRVADGKPLLEFNASPGLSRPRVLLAPTGK